MLVRYIRSSFSLKEVRNMQYIWLVFIKDVLFVIIEPFMDLSAGYSLVFIDVAQKDSNGFD